MERDGDGDGQEEVWFENLDRVPLFAVRNGPEETQKPGVTGAVVWDSAVILTKFLEHAVDSGMLELQGKKCVELGAGCGLAGCVAALLGARVILTDLPDRLRLLQKNVDENVSCFAARGSACVRELSWGDEIDKEVIDPSPDYVIASDVIYNEKAVQDLLDTLEKLCDSKTLVIIAGELRNDAVLEYFLERALHRFSIGRLATNFWHPSYKSQRVVLYALTRISKKFDGDV
ncbi:protein N-lysine methyltransferase METTL21A [Selaginella moellendorffii]|uniref:protein N-lysine methyltransferase METTL21A n=1 Tax=Selaginella moellendorffii TaxID=88036 RepID=UPI000D1C2E03|nr:protein N-lysine methyltransferase METTL21A [Selaginella moellendorffii]|eukprot:XP_024526197.1 protein N-lysine methyltransferase METTL21A [Selaginella moellendorffii]